jgi:hypothetical protein
MSHETAGAVAEKWRQNDAERKVIRPDDNSKLPESTLDGHESVCLEPGEPDAGKNPSLFGMTRNRS